MTELFHWDKNT